MSSIECYQTGRPGLVNVRVSSESLKQEMIQARRGAYANWNLDLPATDPFDECSRTTAFLLKEHGRSVGTIRVTVGNLSASLLTPTSQIFGPEIARLIGSESFVDISRLGVLCSDERRFAEYCFALFQNASAGADENGCPYMLALTRADHTRLYEGMGFCRAAAPVPLAGWPVPVILIVLDWARQRSLLYSHRRYRKVFRNHEVSRLAA